MSAMTMVRRKTSIMVEESLWNEWIHFVLDETGSARRASEEIEKAMREYMGKRKKSR